MGVFDKLKGFVTTSDDEYEDEEDVVEVEYHASETQPISEYEPAPKRETRNSVPTDAKMVLFEPRTFEEAEEIAVHLKQRRAAVVNLHRLQRDYAQRTIDFLAGAVFALDGKIQKIGHNVILCSPKSIGVDGEISLDSGDE